MDAPIYKKDSSISYWASVKELQKEIYDKLIDWLWEKINEERKSEFTRICNKLWTELPKWLDWLRVCIYFWIVAWYLDNLKDISVNTIDAVWRLSINRNFLIKLLEREMDPYRTLREIIYVMNHPAHRDYFNLCSPLELEWKFWRVYKCCQRWIQDFQENYRTEIELWHPNRIREYYFPWGVEVWVPQPYTPLSSNKTD